MRLFAGGTEWINHLSAQIDLTFQTTGANPTGTIISFFGLAAPEGYLACDGTTYNIADYEGLATFILANFGKYNYFGGDGSLTFSVPDLRGEFLRGTGTNAHAQGGAGASVGTHQAPTRHTTVGTGANYTICYSGTASNKLWQNTVGNKDTVSGLSTGSWQNRAGSNVDSSNIVPDWYTSRPTNTSVLYCIKT